MGGPPDSIPSTYEVNWMAFLDAPLQWPLKQNRQVKYQLGLLISLNSLLTPGGGAPTRVAQLHERPGYALDHAGVVDRPR